MNEGGRTAPGAHPGTGLGGRAASETAAREPVAGRGRVWLFVALLVVVPGLLYAAASAVPFMPPATGTKVWSVPVLVVAAEVVFWGAALVFGWEVISRYRRFFDPRTWLRKG